MALGKLSRLASPMKLNIQRQPRRGRHKLMTSFQEIRNQPAPC